MCRTQCLPSRGPGLAGVQIRHRLGGMTLACREMTLLVPLALQRVGAHGVHMLRLVLLYFKLCLLICKAGVTNPPIGWCEEQMRGCT